MAFRLAVGEAVILLHTPPPLVGFSIGMERGCRQNDSLANGCFRRQFGVAADLRGAGGNLKRRLSLSRRREFCRFADTPSPPLLKRLTKGEEGAAERQSRALGAKERASHLVDIRGLAVG